MAPMLDTTPTWETVVGYFLTEVGEELFAPLRRGRGFTPESYELYVAEIMRLVKYVDERNGQARRDGMAPISEAPVLEPEVSD